MLNHKGFKMIYLMKISFVADGKSELISQLNKNTPFSIFKEIF